MKNLKIYKYCDDIDDLISDEDEYNLAKEFLLENNSIKIHPSGFEYNGITELIIELEPKMFHLDVLPVEKYENVKNKYIIQEPTDEIKYLLNIFSFININFFKDMYYYVSVIKRSETNSIEKLNMLSYLLSNIDKTKFNINEIYLNIQKNDVQQDFDEEINIISNTVDKKLMPGTVSGTKKSRPLAGAGFKRSLYLLDAYGFGVILISISVIVRVQAVPALVLIIIAAGGVVSFWKEPAVLVLTPLVVSKVIADPLTVFQLPPAVGLPI